MRDLDLEATRANTIIPKLPLLTSLISMDLSENPLSRSSVMNLCKMLPKWRSLRFVVREGVWVKFLKNLKF